MNFDTFLYGTNYPIIKCKDDEDINFWIDNKEERCSCPRCGWENFSVRDRHFRKVQDTPIHNNNVYINIEVREFKCKNDDCEIKSFTEKLPFVGKNQVRTYVLNEFILIHAIYMSSSTASLILSLLGVKISADTIDNMLKGVEIKDNPDVEMIGTDDVSLRKGISYATAIYDLKDHHLIALIKGREKEDIIPWLKKHPKITLVARDRASSYAKAVDEVFPDAIQVADRFHLFENIVVYLKKLLYSSIPNKIVIKDNKILDKKPKKVIKEFIDIDEEELNKLDYDNTPPTILNDDIIKYYDYLYDMGGEQYKKHAENRIKKYNKVLDIRKDSKDLNIKELKEKYNKSKAFIYKYLKMSDEEVENIKEKKKYNRKKTTNFSEYINIIYKMLIDKVPVEYIVEYIVKKGYTGNLLTLKGVIFVVAKNNNITDINLKNFGEYDYPKDETIITRYELLKYILTVDTKKDKNKIIEDNIEIIENKFSIIKGIRMMFKDFHDTIFSCEPEMLDIFIEIYKDTLSSFCNGLKKDIAAVKNAISNKINSGFVEGNNNKFKLIKRIVYGKQKLCNLFRRCFLAMFFYALHQL